VHVGFIGIGNMGSPMAANIIRSGHQVTVHDLDRERSSAFAREHDCAAASSLADVAQMEFIITMLPNGQIVRDVVLQAEDGGLARHLRRGTVLIDMSSSDPVGTRELGPALAARGAVFMDAPVSGAVPRAKSGTLTIMIGCNDREAIARARPLLASMGDRLFETGSLGSGHAVKALNNFIAAAGYTAAAEALLIGKRFGLDPAVMVDIFNASTGRNFNTEFVMRQHVLSGAYATGFALGLLAKDVRIAADLGAAMKLDAPLARLISERWALARDRLGGGRDNSAAILGWDDDLSPGA
jgi:3-hydroxyisobutyrate dehydrogenase